MLGTVETVPLNALLAEGIATGQAETVVQDIVIDHFAKASADGATGSATEEAAQGSASDGAKNRSGGAGKRPGSRSDLGAS